MNDFAYGYNIVFDSQDCKKSLKNLYVNKVDEISFDKFPFQIDFETNQDREIYLRSKNDLTTQNSLTTWIFVVDDVISFLCNSETSQIFYTPHDKYTDDLMKYWLLHVVSPLYFTLNNTYYFLHTGSVVIEDSATLFMGDSCAGKSTLTDYFLKQGHRLLSDDKLATSIIENEFICQASHTYHRPYRDIETLGIKAENFSKDALKMGVIYWITPVEASGEVIIKELKGLSKFKVLRYSSEMDISINKEKRFEYITKLANETKIFDIEIPRDIERLEEVYSKIIMHNKELKEDR